MNVVISREYNPKETKGIWCIFEGCGIIYQCFTLELPELGNKKKVSCIPEGVYDVIKIYSPTKGKCFHVQDVPGRDAILIHVGNYVSGKKIDTQGCILVGRKFIDLNKDGNIDVMESVKTMALLLSILPDKFKLYII